MFQVTQEIFPIATYVSLVELIFVFLLTDWLRYRPVIFVNAVSYIIMMVLLIWFTSLNAIKVTYRCNNLQSGAERPIRLSALNDSRIQINRVVIKIVGRGEDGIS